MWKKKPQRHTWTGLRDNCRKEGGRGTNLGGEISFGNLNQQKELEKKPVAEQSIIKDEKAAAFAKDEGVRRARDDSIIKELSAKKKNQEKNYLV